MTRTSYGIQVDAWGALIPGKDHLAEVIQQDIAAKLEERFANGRAPKGYDGPVSAFHIEAKSLPFKRLLGFLEDDYGRWHFIVTNKTRHAYEEYSVALRVYPWGEQGLEVSWRLFEKDIVQGLIEPLVMWGLIAAWVLFWIDYSKPFIVSRTFEEWVTLTLSPVGAISLISLIAAQLLFRWVVERSRLQPNGIRRTWLHVYNQYDSRMLALVVSGILLEALDAQNIAPSEVRELRQMQVGRVGMIGAEKADI